MLSVLGVFLIPAFLKFGFLAFGGFLVYNALSGLLGGGFEAEPELDARDVTIDVEAETVDD